MNQPKILFELLLVRHAQSNGNAGIYTGDTGRDRWDSELSEDGERQAKLLAQRFSHYPLDAVLSSGLLRAVHTASAVAAAQPENGSHRVQILPLFTECNVLEDYRGQPIESICRAYPAVSFAADWQGTQTVLPNNEQTDEAYNIDRARQAFAYLSAHFHHGERVMVVAHGMFNTIFFMQAMGIAEQKFDPDFQNTSVTRMIFYEKGTGPWGFDARLCVLNDYAHLHDAFPHLCFEYERRRQPL